ncbi:hypothetical protein TNCV_2148361 [Trichonephila clavipes]|uniref:C2H2-type domain-containing protein n=1 Tax=Trichonephila clavipes TaxID=2585209 RepID=A0A8X6SYU6_TRICX|nr:hypothetical protein TNCV_2148361 [Trichonephila clavipes]
MRDDQKKGYKPQHLKKYCFPRMETNSAPCHTAGDFDGSWIKDSDASFSEQKKRHLHHCTLCSYATSNKCHLKTHFRKHTGERPYLCKVCGKGYSSKQNLQSHEYLHAMQKLHTCKICKENFRNKSALEYHMANQHQFS